MELPPLPLPWTVMAETRRYGNFLPHFPFKSHKREQVFYTSDLKGESIWIDAVLL